MSASHLPQTDDGTVMPPKRPAAATRRSATRSSSTIFVVAAEPITDVDTTAADMLEELDEDLNAQGISLVVADMKDRFAKGSNSTS